MAKNIKYYRGKYYQGGLTDAKSDALLTLVQDYDCVTSLRHVIKDTPKHIVQDAKSHADDYRYNNGTMRGYIPPNLGEVGVGTLRDAQTIGVAFMYYAESALLGDEVGLGKTVQIAGLINLLAKEYESQGKPFRYLFLAEKSSAGQIRDKLMQFTGEYVELLESGEKKVIDDYIYATEDNRPYSIVGSHSLVLSPVFLMDAAKKPYDLIIFDESSQLKNAQNEYHINCKELFKRHNRKILLNATPLEIEIREMYNQLNLLDPDYLPTITEFNKTFTKTKKGMYGYQADGYKNEELFKDAIKLKYLARTRQGLGANYEDNEYKTILVPLTPTQKELNKKTSLKQMVTDYPTGVDRNVGFDEFTTPKLAVLFKVLDDKMEIGVTQALIYCSYIGAQNEMKVMLEERGYRVVVLNGKSSTKQRAEIVEEYNYGQYDIMITNILRGIDLNTCDMCILYTIDPNPQKMVQFEGRMTRGFDIEKKAVYMLVSMGKEKKFVESILKLRVGASAAFTTTGKSMVLEAINSEENKEMYVIGGEEDL